MEVHESPAEVMVDGKELSSELPLIALTDNFHSAWNKLGRSWGEVKKFVCYMENAGFVDVEATIMRLPLGTWPSDPTEKLVGRYNLLNFLEGVQGHCLQLFTKVLDMDLQEARQLITLCEKDVQNRRHRIYFDL